MKTPITIVTGALGSGKTTFLNRILTANHGLKIGVVVNEFGKIGVDSKLIVATKENLIELANGCICCMIRDDLIQATQQLLDTKKVDYIIVETSGLADVVPVAMTYGMTDELTDYTDLDSIICIVDAENYDNNLKRDHIAFEQMMASDIILLNKLDLVDDKEKQRIENELKQKMPYAQIIHTIKGNADLKLILGVGKFDPDKCKKWKGKKHGHTTNVDSYSAITGPVDPDKIQEFLENLPDTIFRAKGIVCIKESKKGEGDEYRVVFHKVGKRTEMDFETPWREGEKRETVIVFIGTDLDSEKLQKKLDDCQ